MSVLAPLFQPIESRTVRSVAAGRSPRASRIRRGLALLVSGLLALPVAAQVNDLTTVPLVPSLPNYFGPTPPSPYALGNYRLTMGDLDADGIDDLVFSNALAFLRVYFLKKDVNGVPFVNSWQDILPYDPLNPGQCSSVGAGARFLTVGQHFLDTPLIYDINLDGVNDLVYLEHIPNPANKGTVGLRIYKTNMATHVVRPDSHMSPGSLLPLINNNGYFASGCGTGDKENGASFHLRVVNVRGRAFPQDILVWTQNPPYAPNFFVFGYDANASGAATLTLLIQHDTWYGPSPLQGLSGHTWRGFDIDLDGKEEIIGKHVVSYSPGAQGNKTIRWGVILKSDPNILDPGDADGPHPDHVAGMDIVKSYRNPAGQLIPSPGAEIVVAPHVHGTPNAADRSGPLLYRALTGHQTSGFPVAWPRKLLNINSTGDGAKYWFPSSNAAGWLQPTASSHWNDLGNAFISGPSIEQKTPDPQTVFPCDIVYDPLNGVDQQPGSELVVIDKLGSMGGDCSIGQISYVFSTGDGLTALGWGENSSTTINGPTILGTFPVDLEGTRDPIEIHSIVRFNCPNPFLTGHAILRWNKLTNDPQNRSFAPTVIYARSIVANEMLGGIDGTFASDLMGDRREEVLFFRNSNPQGNSFQNSELVVVRDLSAQSFTEPAPQKFLDYRLRSYGFDPQDLDYKSFEGLRFRTRTLMPGKVNTAYGVAQDKKLVGSLPLAKQTGFAILAEGGKGPFSIAISSGVLPAGLATQALSLPSGHPAGALLIYGTPIEVTTKRLEVTVTDSSIPPQVRAQSFWITVAPGGGGQLAQPDSLPRIITGGFENAYLLAGSTPQTLPVTAVVDDVNDDVASVKLYDKNGALQATLANAGGSLWTGTFQASLPFAGRDTWYTLRAEDQAGNVSVPWPYLVVNGGPGKENPAFLDEPFIPQPQSLTPLVTKVGMPAHSIPAAEVSDGQGTQGLTVYVDRRGMTVTKIEARILHHLPGIDPHRYEKLLVPPVGTLDQYALTFDPPAAGELGWGYYTVNVQVTVQAAGGATYVSDWWPQLTAH